MAAPSQASGLSAEAMLTVDLSNDGKAYVDGNHVADAAAVLPGRARPWRART
ncbi:hypothetical protein WMF11_25700 [Sorangium sp. So ce295]|uniref:hypothetical protein n=1 Tax=Sorangium sp. So ce295 TaxID=3133295 RepID=UPI003F637872